jgi:hypothetical protein
MLLGAVAERVSAQVRWLLQIARDNRCTAEKQHRPSFIQHVCLPVPVLSTSSSYTQFSALRRLHTQFPAPPAHAPRTQHPGIVHTQFPAPPAHAPRTQYPGLIHTQFPAPPAHAPRTQHLGLIHNTPSQQHLSSYTQFPAI